MLRNFLHIAWEVWCWLADHPYMDHRQLYKTEKAKQKKEPQEAASVAALGIPDLLRQVPLVKKVSSITVLHNSICIQDTSASPKAG